MILTVLHFNSNNHASIRKVVLGKTSIKVSIFHLTQHFIGMPDSTAGPPTGVNANGDRLPTRERGYRSANHYVRRRTAMPPGINNGGIPQPQPGGLQGTSPYQEGGLGEFSDPSFSKKAGSTN